MLVLSPSVAAINASARSIPASDRSLRAGGWHHFDGPELSGKTLGLLGLGAIGAHMAGLGRGLGMRVVGWSLRIDPVRADAAGVELVEFDDLFRISDVVSIHLRLSPRSLGLVGEREIRLMKPDAILVNTARAGIVDQAALVAALRSGRLGGAGLDVHDPEPLPSEQNPYLELENVVLTPHSGSVTREATLRSLREPVENVIAFLEGRPQNVVSAG